MARLPHKITPGKAGDKFVSWPMSIGADSHDSDTPKVVHQFQFNPLDYDLDGATRTLTFEAVAANGDTGITTHVQLYNLTDGEAIATLNFTSQTPTAASSTLTEGAGVGQVDQSAKVYEVRIYVDTPDMVNDTIELGSASLRVESVVG